MSRGNLPARKNGEPPVSYIISGAVHAAVIGVVLAVIGPVGIAFAFAGGVMVLTIVLLAVVARPAFVASAAVEAHAAPEASEAPETVPAPAESVVDWDAIVVADPFADVELRPAPAAVAVANSSNGHNGHLAIPDYEQLSAARILPLLAGLTPEQLSHVRDIETAGSGRVTILRGIDKLLHPKPVAKKPAAKKAAAKKAAPKKAAAKKPVAKKAAVKEPTARRTSERVVKKATTASRKRAASRSAAGRK